MQLEPQLRHCRLDHQSGTEGEYWRLAGGADPIAIERFEALAILGGKKLKAYKGLTSELSNIPDDLVRWYQFLASNRRFYQDEIIGYPTDEAGKVTGYIMSGSINSPAAVSAAQCLNMAAMIDEDDLAAAPMSIHVIGPNARVNLGSVDASTNIVRTEHREVFAKVRQQINDKIGADKEGLLQQVDELEQAANTPTYASLYAAFVASIADHITILGPFLPILAQFTMSN